MILRRAIVGTVLRLTTEAMDTHPTGEVVSVAVEAVETAVMKCWLGIFNLWEKFWFLLLMIGYTLYVVKDDLYLVWLPMLQLLIDFIVYYYRTEGQVVSSTIALRTSDSWKTMLINTADVRYL